jgi:hypothetical protein
MPMAIVVGVMIDPARMLGEAAGPFAMSRSEAAIGPRIIAGFGGSGDEKDRRSEGPKYDFSKH